MEYPFISIDGVPGSGKTTVRDAVIQQLIEIEIPIYHVGQHGWMVSSATQTIISARKGTFGITYYELANALIDDKISHFSKNIQPYLSSSVVIADRFILSDLFLLATIYQDNYDNFSYYLEKLSQIYVRPDINFILTLPRHHVKDRLSKRYSHRYLDNDFSLSKIDCINKSNVSIYLGNKNIWMQNIHQDDVLRCSSLIVNEVVHYLKNSAKNF